MGAGQSARRKSLRRGQRSVMVRLRLGACERVLGVAAPELTSRIIALEELWGRADAARLLERLAEASDTLAAARILKNAILARAPSDAAVGAPASLALEAARRLAAQPGGSVSAVADELAVSERHLRRLFQVTLGVGPKAYAKLARFHRALRAARAPQPAGWASIAASSGYFDQAHLIAEFRTIAGVPPRELLRELQTSGVIGRV
jgi:AraC-like DNA-binding protein